MFHMTSAIRTVIVLIATATRLTSGMRLLHHRHDTPTLAAGPLWIEDAGAYESQERAKCDRMLLDLILPSGDATDCEGIKADIDDPPNTTEFRKCACPQWLPTDVLNPIMQCYRKDENYMFPRPPGELDLKAFVEPFREAMCKPGAKSNRMRPFGGLPTDNRVPDKHCHDVWTAFASTAQYVSFSEWKSLFDATLKASLERLRKEGLPLVHFMLTQSGGPGGEFPVCSGRFKMLCKSNMWLLAHAWPHLTEAEEFHGVLLSRGFRDVHMNTDFCARTINENAGTPLPQNYSAVLLADLAYSGQEGADTVTQFAKVQELLAPSSCTGDCNSPCAYAVPLSTTEGKRTMEWKAKPRGAKKPLCSIEIGQSRESHLDAMNDWLVKQGIGYSIRKAWFATGNDGAAPYITQFKIPDAKSVATEMYELLKFVNPSWGVKGYGQREPYKPYELRHIVSIGNA